ncbi:hypothetical protein GCK32_009592 [Trichostrongylus colubriformis]|uniref:Uncharacterized protein n=1 Tax=Trichostrongylus colubriformis TaxID=6319 RepID=A0AAN8FRD2_TRICO
MVPPLEPIVTGKPFEIVAADILKMGLSSSAMEYKLVVVDHSSNILHKQLKPVLGFEELKLGPFKAHKRKEREKPAIPQSPGNRKPRKRAACRVKDRMRAAA